MIWAITAWLSTSSKGKALFTYNLLGNVLHARVNGKHMDLSRNCLPLLKINAISDSRPKRGTNFIK